jgi:hypothetical protein
MNLVGQSFVEMDVVATLGGDHATQATISLTNTDGSPKYSRIVLVDDGLTYDAGAAGWISALSAANWAALDAYQVAHNVPSISLAAYPDAAKHGVAIVDGLSGGTTRSVYVTSEGASSAALEVTTWSHEVTIPAEQATTTTAFTTYVATGNVASVVRTTSSGAKRLVHFTTFAIWNAGDAALMTASWNWSLLQLGETLPTPPAPTTAPTTAPLSPVIRSRVLLLETGTDAAQIGVAKQTFEAVGVAYDVVNAVASPELAVTLINSEDGSGLYDVIVMESSSLAHYDSASDSWPSALSSTQWATLWQYCRDYSVRSVALSGNVDPAMGVTLVLGGTSTAAESYLAPAALAADPSVVATRTFELESLWRYEVSITNPSTTVAFTKVKNPVEGAADNVVSIVHTDAQGLERLIFYHDAATWSESKELGPVWWAWVSRGRYPGVRRCYFSVQIDDVYLPTTMYQGGLGSGATLRIGAEDAAFHPDVFFPHLNSNILPAGSNVTLELAFNGAGIEEYTTANGVAYPTGDPLYEALHAAKDKYLWVSHTHTHQNLNAVPQSQAEEEIALNNQVAAMTADPRGFLLTSTGQPQTYWSPNELVTPEISGLFNGAALAGLYAQGIRTCVGDNSRSELVPQTSLYHGFYTTQEVHGFAGIHIIPRHTSSPDYNVAYPHQSLAQRTDIYGTLYGSTLEEIYSYDAKRAAGHLTMYRHDPYMQHQANMKTFEFQRAGESAPQTRSLTSFWMELVAEEYSRKTTLPLRNLSYKDLARAFRDREARDACGAEVTWVRASPGDLHPTSVRLVATNGDCEMALTGVSPATEAARVAVNARVETYGPDVTTWIPLAQGVQVEMPVAPAA